VKPPDAHTSRASFVAADVKENEVTTRILNQIYGYFPQTFHVISGYLSLSDLLLEGELPLGCDARLAGVRQGQRRMEGG